MASLTRVNGRSMPLLCRIFSHKWSPVRNMDGSTRGLYQRCLRRGCKSKLILDYGTSDQVWP